MTIKEATKNGPAVCLIGENRLYAIGDTAYRFYPAPKEHQGPPAFTNTTAKGHPVIWIDDDWRPSLVAKPIYRRWTDVVTIL